MALERPYVDIGDNSAVATSLFRAVGVIAGGFLVLALFQSLAYELIDVSTAEQLRQVPLRYAAVSALPGLSFVVASLGYMRMRDDRSLFGISLPASRDLLWIGIGLVSIVAAYLLASGLITAISALLSTLFGISVAAGENAIIGVIEANPEVILYLIPVTVFVVAPGEELLFRGVVQGLLRRSLGVVPAIAGASLLFGGIHVFSISSGDAWTYVLVATALGAVLGTIYEYTENLVVPIVVHAVWNAALFTLTYYQVMGLPA